MKTMTTQTTKTPSQYNLLTALNTAKIKATGRTADGKNGAIIVFPDGKEGSFDYELLRTHMVQQGKSNRAMLEAIGYKSWMSCVAGLCGSETFENAEGDHVTISGAHLNRIVRGFTEITLDEQKDMLRRSCGVSKKDWDAAMKKVDAAKAVA